MELCEEVNTTSHRVFSQVTNILLLLDARTWVGYGLNTEAGTNGAAVGLNSGMEPLAVLLG